MRNWQEVNWKSGNEFTLFREFLANFMTKNRLYGLIRPMLKKYLKISNFVIYI